MTYQRRRGIPATFFPIIDATDNRGNTIQIHDEANPLKTTIWLFPQRGGKAEVTGQQTINVVRIGCTADLPDVGLRARVEFMGHQWDVVSPPSFHVGASRHTRHYAMDVRQRP